MSTEKDAKDGQENPEEKKGFFERIGDFLSQPLPGTGSREQEEDEKPTPRPTPTPAASTPATPPASASHPATPTTPPAASTPATPPASASHPATPKPNAPPETLHVPPAPVHTSATSSSPPLVSAKSEEKAGSSVVGGAAQAAGGAARAASEAAQSAPGKLVVGRTVYVRSEGGMPLRMRSAPDLQPDNIVARLPIGSPLTLLEGPKEEDGYEWWQVRTADGHTGWVAGSELVTEQQ